MAFDRFKFLNAALGVPTAWPSAQAHTQMPRAKSKSKKVAMLKNLAIPPGPKQGRYALLFHDSKRQPEIVEVDPRRVLSIGARVVRFSLSDATGLRNILNVRTES